MARSSWRRSRGILCCSTLGVDPRTTTNTTSRVLPTDVQLQRTAVHGSGRAHRCARRLHETLGRIHHPTFFASSDPPQRPPIACVWQGPFWMSQRPWLLSPCRLPVAAKRVASVSAAAGGATPVEHHVALARTCNLPSQRRAQRRRARREQRHLDGSMPVAVPAAVPAAMPAATLRRCCRRCPLPHRPRRRGTRTPPWPCLARSNRRRRRVVPRLACTRRVIATLKIHCGRRGQINAVPHQGSGAR